MRKPYCLTIGDPKGIGPEITAKFLQAWYGTPHGKPPVLVLGDIDGLRQAAASLGLTLPEQDVEYQNVPGQLPGTVSYQALVEAVRHIAKGEATMLVTGPISKEHLHQAGFPYGGHTEILQDLANELYSGGPYRSEMLFLYRNFRMLLLTRHIPLHDVSKALTVDGVADSLGILVRFLQESVRIPQPRLCLLGVNPHAGEIGGHEERDVLTPAMQQVAERFGVPMTEPVAADGAFRGFDVAKVPYDAYVAAYHDQGLIPFKLVAGMQAVNVTIGLPFVRTSVSHGTAMDIVGEGKADPGSLIEAATQALALMGLNSTP